MDSKISWLSVPIYVFPLAACSERETASDIILNFVYFVVIALGFLHHLLQLRAEQFHAAVQQAP